MTWLADAINDIKKKKTGHRVTQINALETLYGNNLVIEL